MAARHAAEDAVLQRDEPELKERPSPDGGTVTVCNLVGGQEPDKLMDAWMDGWVENTERKVQGNKNQNKTCDAGGMTAVSAWIGEMGITGIIGEGGAASAC